MVFSKSRPTQHVRSEADKPPGEPEFRLIFMSIALVFCTIGMCLFGYTMSVGSAAPLCAFFQGVMYV